MSNHKVYFLRHGITDNNIKNITQPQFGSKLSVMGYESAKALVPETLEALQGQPFILVHSTAERAKETAELYKEHATTVVESKLLLEVDFGDFAGKHESWRHDNGKTMADYREQMLSGDFDFSFPNGESMSDVAERVEAVLAMIDNLRAKHNVVIIGHNRMFRHIELQYRINKTGDAYYAGMFGSKYPHACVYDIDSAFEQL